MFKKVYGVWDKKGKDYLGPLFVFPNDAVAGRSVSDACADGTQLRIHPEDYSVVALGELDGDGVLRAFDTPRLIVTVLELITPAGALADSPREEQRVLPFVKEA